MISEYSKFVPLEKPTNEDAKYFVSVMNQVGQRMEQNYNSLQAYTEQLSGIDIFRATDKSYFDNKINILLVLYH